jgi:hypothetical protein
MQTTSLRVVNGFRLRKRQDCHTNVNKFLEILEKEKKLCQKGHRPFCDQYEPYYKDSSVHNSNRVKAAKQRWDKKNKEKAQILNEKFRNVIESVLKIKIPS